MQNMNKKLALVGFALIFGAASAWARQTDTAPVSASRASEMSSNVSGESGPGDAAAGRGACWKEAGLSKSTMEQRKSIVTDAKARVRNAESDTTLGFAQRKQQIRQIRMDMRQQLGKLVSPDQEEVLRQCRRDRAAAGGGQGAADTSNTVSPAPKNPGTDPQPQ
jgi:hypothetical protein